MNEFLNKIYSDDAAKDSTPPLVRDIISKEEVPPATRTINVRDVDKTSLFETPPPHSLAKHFPREEPLTAAHEPTQPIHTEQKGVKRYRLKWIFVSGGVLLIIFLGVAIFTRAFGHLTITVEPLTTTIQVPSTMITADVMTTVADFKTKKIPALQIEVQRTGEIFLPTTGKKYVEAKAQGKIIITNASSVLPQSLVRQTRFADPSGKIFRLTKSVIVPAVKSENGKIIPGSIIAEVIADSAGEVYNSEPTTFTIPGFKGTSKYSIFAGRSTEAFTGGFKGEMPIASAADKKKAEQELSENLYNNLKKELEDKTPSKDGFIIIPGSRAIEITSLTQVKDTIDSTKLKIIGKGRADVFVFKRDDLFQIFSALFLSTETPSFLSPTRADIQYKSASIDNAKKGLQFSVEGKIFVVRSLDAEKIKSAAVGQKLSVFETYLRSRPEISGFVIKNFPQWRLHAPADPRAIDITILNP